MVLTTPLEALGAQRNYSVRLREVRSKLCSLLGGDGYRAVRV